MVIVDPAGKKDKPEIRDLELTLINSHWPKCDQIAETIRKIGGKDATNALISGLKGKRHHVRSAAIRSLTKIGDKSLAAFIEPYLNDPSYEVRMDAKQAIKSLTGQDVKTGRGE